MSNGGNISGGTGRGMAWFLGTLGSLSVVAFLVWVLNNTTRPADLAAARAVERAKFRAEVEQASAVVLQNYTWKDKTKGVVSLPIERAMDLVAQEWQNPAQARAAMISRIEELTAPPPEPENPYE